MRRDQHGLQADAQRLLERIPLFQLGLNSGQKRLDFFVGHRPPKRTPCRREIPDAHRFFRRHSRRLMDAFVRGELTLVLSELTLKELAPAPPAVRAVLGAVPDDHIEIVTLAQAVDDLARRYVADGILKANMLADGRGGRVRSRTPARR